MIADLKESLKAWSPLPSRLLIAKLRKELEERGAIAEDKALGNNKVLAGWYYELLNADSAKQSFLLQETLNRHTEQLMNEVSAEIIKFSKFMVTADTRKIPKPPEAEAVEKIIKSHFNVDLADPQERALSELEHNVFICSTKPSGEHLKTGHIFKMDGGYWVCLSPLCDLVPGQKTSGMFGDVGNRMPFLAVKFRQISGDNPAVSFNKIKDDIQSNRYIFLNEGGKNVILCINESGNGNVDSAPHWYPLYGSNRGRFSSDFGLTVSKLSEASNKRLVFNNHKITVSAQLRYEYALNLMQKLGASLNRIGLDFSG